MSDFFDKLKKGMDTENVSLPEETTKEDLVEESSEEEPIEEEPAPEKPEVTLTSIEVPKKRATRRKTVKKKAVPKKKAAPKESPKKEKIKIKQGFILSEDDIESNDIFEKEGQLTVDVFETKDSVIIQSAVAGITPDDLDISIEKDVVSIKGKRERRFEEKTENFLYQECYWGKFSREIVLPSEVDKSKAEAVMKDGILTIKIPKINKKVNIE